MWYDIAVLDEYEPWRRWIAAQLAHLPSADASIVERRLWMDESFWPVLMELNAGAHIRSLGFQARYEERYESLTPDWTVYGLDGERLAIVEVCTYSPAKSIYGQIRAWQALASRIRRIPVPVVLVLGPSSSRVPPPSAGVAKRIAKQLQGELLRVPGRDRFISHGYEFVCLPLGSPHGIRACFQPPSSIAGPVDAGPVCESVDEKARKYRALASSLNVSLIVAAGAHRFTGVDSSHIEALMRGDATSRFQFSLGDVHVGERQIDLSNLRRWSIPSELLGLLWLGNKFPFDCCWIPNPRGQGVMTTMLAK